MFKTATAAMVALAVTTGLAQGVSPVVVPVGTPRTSQVQPLAGRGGIATVAGNKTPAPATLRERVQDMETTLAKMHAVLKQMRSKAASKDPLAKANLDMWELLVGHLDKQLQELRIAMVTREDMEARRAAMYKQAEAKADAAAQAARKMGAGKAAAAPAAPDAGHDTSGQAPANQAPAAPANTTPSPN